MKKNIETYINCLCSRVVHLEKQVGGERGMHASEERDIEILGIVIRDLVELQEKNPEGLGYWNEVGQ